MNDILKVLQAGDLAGLEMEKARAVVDAARSALEEARAKFEFAKQAFEDVAESAEEAGVAKAKFKKMIEERTAILWNSGIAGNVEAKTPKAARAPRAKKAVERPDDANVIDFETGEMHGELREEALAN